MTIETEAERFDRAHLAQAASLDEKLNSDIVVAVRRRGDEEFVTLPTVDMAVGATCWGRSHPEWTEMELLIGPERWDLRARYADPETVGEMIVEFEDGSALRLDDRVRRHPEPLDDGVTLLMPVSMRETQGVERLLGLLWDAAANGHLTEAQERKILSIAEMIEREHRATVAEETERWRLVGAVGSGLRFLLNELPEGVVKWGAAGVILTNIDWTNMARVLPG